MNRAALENAKNHQLSRLVRGAGRTLALSCVLPALASCGANSDSLNEQGERRESVATVSQAVTSSELDIEFVLYTHWHDGYCAGYFLENTSSEPLAWEVNIAMNDAELNDGWQATYEDIPEGIRVTPPPWQTTLPPGGQNNFGYCARKTGENWMPEIIEGGAAPEGLIWPIACTPGEDCTVTNYPDPDGNGIAYDCSMNSIPIHDGTDVAISYEQMDAGVDVLAAADGEVIFVSDGKYDRCPDADEPDCQEPSGYFYPGMNEGTTVCTELGPYYSPSCTDGECFWCFAGGNVAIIRHDGLDGVFATRYDHFKTNSITVEVGDVVSAGDKIGEVGSAGASSGPHLHFEVWSEGWYDITDPFLSQGCGTNETASLWQEEPPWE